MMQYFKKCSEYQSIFLSIAHWVLSTHLSDTTQKKYSQFMYFLQANDYKIYFISDVFFIRKASV